MHKDSVYVREILRAGARGYLLKDSIAGDFLAAVRAVARGEGYISPSVSNAVLDDYRKHVTDPLDLLTSREREVLQMIAEGKTKRQALKCVERRLVNIIWGMMTYRTEYINPPTCDSLKPEEPVS
jgi:FixJ family two-component response regulator